MFLYCAFLVVGGNIMIEKKMDKFLKCDLHLHSSTDYSRKYSKREFVNKLKSIDLDVVSITDHNIIDTNLYKELILNKDIHQLFIGGCELNISLGKETIKKHKLKVKNKFFHAVIWYDIEDLDDMWSSIKKYIKDNAKEFDNIENMNLTELSRKLADFSFELDKLQMYIKHINYYFIFHENKGNRNLSDYLDNSIKENEIYKEKLFYYNNNLALDGSAKNKKLTTYFEKSLNTIVSSFLFSDAKQINEIGNKFSWINFDGKFKNIILAFSDPDIRIFRSDEVADNPQKNRDNYLESIKFNLLYPSESEEKNIITRELYFFSRNEWYYWF